MIVKAVVVVRPDLVEDRVCLWWVVVVISAVLGQSCELPVCAVGRGLWPELGCRPFSQIALPVVVVSRARCL